MRRTLRLLLVVFAVFSALAGAWAAARSRTWQVAGTIVARVDTPDRVLALTFDDGPTDLGMDAVLPALASRGVRATFFLVGAEVEANPEAARRIVAGGHALGNHSWSHERMVFVRPAWVRQELDRTDAALRALGVPGPFPFRAPYCKKGVALPLELARTGRVHVTFDVEPESDPSVVGSADAIVRHVRERVRPGSIVLLHPHYGANAATREALPALLDGLLADGWAFVTVGELLGRGPAKLYQ